MWNIYPLSKYGWMYFHFQDGLKKLLALNLKCILKWRLAFQDILKYFKIEHEVKVLVKMNTFSAVQEA